MTWGSSQDPPSATHLVAADEVLGRGLLEDEPGRAGLHRSPEDLVVVEGGEHQDRGRIVELADPAGGLDPVHATHAHVHADDVHPRAGRRQRLQRRGSVAALARDGEPVGR